MPLDTKRLQIVSSSDATNKVQLVGAQHDLLHALQGVLLHVRVAVRQEGHHVVLKTQVSDYAPSLRVRVDELCHVTACNRQRLNIVGFLHELQQHPQNLEVLLLKSLQVCPPKLRLRVYRAPRQRARQHLPAILLKARPALQLVGQSLLQVCQELLDVLVAVVLHEQNVHNAMEAPIQQLCRQALVVAVRQDVLQRQQRNAQHLFFADALHHGHEAVHHLVSSCKGIQRRFVVRQLPHDEAGVVVHLQLGFVRGDFQGRAKQRHRTLPQEDDPSLSRAQQPPQAEQRQPGRQLGLIRPSQLTA